jgi:hypothetical protein
VAVFLYQRSGIYLITNIIRLYIENIFVYAAKAQIHARNMVALRMKHIIPALCKQIHTYQYFKCWYTLLVDLY